MADEKKDAGKTMSHQDMMRMKSRKLISNLIVITIILTIAGVGATSVGGSSVFAFVAGAMLPGIIVFLADWRPGKFASKTIIAFNLAGLTPYAAAIFSSGSPNNTAINILRDPTVWMVVYGAASFGWIVVFLIPHITKMYLQIKAEHTINKLSHFQEKLTEEWGEDIKKMGR